MRYISYFFLVLVIINCATLIPIYATADPEEKVITLAETTVINVWLSEWRVWIAFVFILINAALAYALAFKFWRATLVYSASF